MGKKPAAAGGTGAKMPPTLDTASINGENN